MKYIIRKGTKNDITPALKLVKELALYEKAPLEVEVTEQEMLKEGFGPNAIFEFFVAELDKKIIGIALYYYKYSTWKGRCIYLDDIVVTEKYRRCGIGKKLFDEVVRVGKEKGVRKIEWQVLDWNEPAIGFYKKLGTNFDGEWINCKLSYSQIQNFND